LVLQTRQRPVLDRLRRRQRAQEIAEVVGERMKLEPRRVGGERSARQSRPLDRAFALLDPLLARPALVVESNDALGLAAHARHDEADAGIKLAGMAFDFGNHPARLGPASVHLDDSAPAPKHNIRAARELASMDASMDTKAISHTVEQAPDDDLRTGILSTISSHNLTSSLGDSRRINRHAKLALVPAAWGSSFEAAPPIHELRRLARFCPDWLLCLRQLFVEFAITH